MPASLIGESVHLKVTYSVTTQELVNINQVLIDKTFTVTNGTEIADAISYTFQSGGFPHTLSGTIGANIGSDTATFSFSGTAQPGGLTYELTSIADQSAQAVSGVTVTNQSGFQSGVNYFIDPTITQNNLSATLGLLGFQPGTNLSETIKLALVDSSVDTTPPDTSVTSGPAALTNSTAAAFAFASTEAGGKFQTSLDGTAFQDSTANPTLNVTEGTHTLQVRAVDDAGNIDPTPASYTWKVDLTPPDTSVISGPATLTNSTSAVFAFASTETGGKFQVSLDGSTFADSTADKTFNGVGEGFHTLQVRAVDAAGNIDPSVENYTWTIDTTAPETTLTSKPAALINISSATFQATSNDNGAHFEAAIDGGTYTVVDKNFNIDSLSDGNHTVVVRAVDAAGNADATPESVTFKVDTTAPETTIDSSPSALTNSADATFIVSSDEAGSTFQVSLDNATFADATSPISYTALADGQHSFQVRSIDAAGNVDQTPATYTWTVDTVAPDTVIASSPAALSNSSTAVFSFTSTEPGATYEVSLNGGAFVTATDQHTLAGLADGAYSLDVRSIDAAGNVDATPATYQWTVDTTAPDTSILKSPISTTFDRIASFNFDSSEHGTHFQVSLDGKTFVDATDNYQTAVDFGAHSLEVRAIDDAGNVDSTPAAFHWTVIPDTSNDGSQNPSGGQGPGATDGTDIFISGPTDERFDGAGGTDYVVFTGKAADYTFTLGPDGLPSRIAGPDGTDTLINIERLKFSDGVVAFDAEAAQVYRLYEAALDRAPETAGLSFWVNQLDTGAKSLLGAASDFLNSKEFTQHFGDVHNMAGEKLVQTFYQNILGRAGETAGVAYWSEQLDHGLSAEKMLLFFSESAENQAATNTQIVGGVHLDNSVFPVA